MFKRLPGLAYKYKSISLFLIFLVAIVVYSLLSWGFICTNLEPWSHLNQMCNDFKKREVFGDLCHTLCSKNGIESLSCHAFHAGKDTVFSAVLRGDIRVVVKSSNKDGEPPEVFHWVDSEGKERYPTEEQFILMVKEAVRLRLNVTIDEDDSKRLSHFAGGQTSSDHNSELRFMEMREVWSLLQNQEYLMSMVHHQKELFPEVVGSCGQYFVTEYIKPALGSSIDVISMDSTSMETWATRVHLAVGILELIEQLDAEGIILCDIKPSHFGIAAGDKIKFLDLDIAFPKTFADSMTANHRSCTSDSECNFFDCKSTCDPHSKLCEAPIINSNMQIVCEKILLGWTMPGRLIVPGLLMTSHTPQSLVSLLRQCAQGSIANSEHEEISKHVSERLMATLSELDSSLEGFRS